MKSFNEFIDKVNACQNCNLLRQKLEARHRKLLIEYEKDLDPLVKDQIDDELTFLQKLIYDMKFYNSN